MKITWKSIISTGVSIAFGFALGLSATHWHRPPPHEQPFPGSDPGGHFIRRMSHKLDLNKEQEVKIQEIFQKHSEKMKAVHDEVFPKIEQLRKEIDAQIRPLLSEEQANKFDRIHEKRRKFRGHRFGEKSRKGRRGRHHRPPSPSDHESMENFGHPPPPPPMGHEEPGEPETPQQQNEFKQEKTQ